MSETDKADLTALKRRRGVVRASVTKQATKLKDLEAKASEPSTRTLAQRMSRKLDDLETEFRKYHYEIIDKTADENAEALGKEQETLDQFDDIIAERIELLIASSSSSSDTGEKKIASRRLSHAKSSLSSLDADVSALGESPEPHLLHQYQEQLTDVKGELASIRHSLLPLELDEEDELYTAMAELEKQLFHCNLQVKKLLYPSSLPAEPPSESSGSKGVRLPKLDVPSFDGHILNWQSFWEQFCVAVHDRTNISDIEKLVYLRNSLKDGSAKNAIEGLSHSGEQYKEAIQCLRSRYDRPRLIHQAHVKKIVDIPPIKEGTGKELGRLHDVAQQHLRALKAMKQEPSGSFITSLLELKLDASTTFEWQKASQEATTTPHYNDLIEFINLRTQASETISTESRPRSATPRVNSSNKSVTSFTASASDPDINCILCKTERHPLYACPQFSVRSPKQQVLYELPQAWSLLKTVPESQSLSEVSKATSHPSSPRVSSC